MTLVDNYEPKPVAREPLKPVVSIYSLNRANDYLGIPSITLGLIDLYRESSIVDDASDGLLNQLVSMSKKQRR